MFVKCVKYDKYDELKSLLNLQQKCTNFECELPLNLVENPSNTLEKEKLKDDFVFFKISNFELSTRIQLRVLCFIGAFGLQNSECLGLQKS